jgi:hypothetical protein
MDGCTSQGYYFNMAIVTTVPGSTATAWRDEFTLFFNITAQADCSGSTPSCSAATLDGQ